MVTRLALPGVSAFPSAREIRQLTAVLTSAFTTETRPSRMMVSSSASSHLDRGELTLPPLSVQYNGGEYALQVIEQQVWTQNSSDGTPGNLIEF